MAHPGVGPICLYSASKRLLGSEKLGLRIDGRILGSYAAVDNK
jgi:hypothetical protein